MNPSEVGEVLTLASVYDGRDVTEIDATAWHQILGTYDRADAIEAVRRHYTESTDWMRPAHVVKHILAIRNARAEAKHHEIRALPSRFEADEIRDQRVKENIARLAEALSMPTETSDDPRAAALARAKRERRESGRAAPAPRQRSTNAKPIDLAKVPGPDWANAEFRERAAVAELHRLGRTCGLAACQKCAKAA